MRSLLLSAVCLCLSGCVAVAAGIASVGASAGVGHHVNGTSYRTFTAPLWRVDSATREALKLMAINLQSVEKTQTGQLFRATIGDRRVEIELEALTPNATRLRSVAYYRGGLVLDAATGTEIVAQTEKLMAQPEPIPPRPSNKRSAPERRRPPSN